ncbi:hypothetical protein [Hathewaya limosa]|uniref:Membrane protein n=1 Tax=Hathewaya limosa TaxID=1536 RepID=A0ABU0JN35_HATLI|nr:hypothetical protein [Hathewaya limosa]AWZ49224.1 hypothetical protein C3495_10525 [Clostridiaceae bacterium 14S0207]MDQ0478491.1 putative membrane protein [Hathewaya limosa]
MQIVKIILMALLVVFTGLLLFGVLTQTVFKKFKVNKWIILLITIVAILLPPFFRISYNKGFLGLFVFPVIYIVLVLWFLQTSGLLNSKDQREKEKKKQQQEVIRPKAKPNRVKNNKKTNK